MGIMLRMRTLSAGFIAPCLPTKTDKLPSGSQWLHEIKHDGFRVIARKDGPRVRLYSRPGNDLTRRFPLIVETLARLRSRSCLIDGEAVCCDDNGLPIFEKLRATEKINGQDLRRKPTRSPAAAMSSLGCRLAWHIPDKLRQLRCAIVAHRGAPKREPCP
jgi:ATP-dependent DNA ligase